MNRHLLLLCMGIAAPLVAWSQEDASRIEKRFQQTPIPKSTVRPLLIPLQEQIPPEKASQIRFNLKQVIFVGNTTFSKEEMSRQSSKMVGKNISLDDLYRLRDAITAKYGNAGFGLSKAIIPEQNIQQASGIVRIEILEGFIDSVVIENASTDQQSFLEDISTKIKAERPLNVKTLEHYLLLANDRFAIKVTATMMKSEKTPAASTLILKVEPASLIDGGAGLDNRGTEAVGRTQINGNLTVNGIFGLASQTSLAYVTSKQTKELQYWALSQTGILSDEGTAFTLSYNNIKSAPGIPTLVLLDQKSSSGNWSIKLAHPFIRTRQDNLSAHLTYDYKNTNSKQLGNIISEDKTRSLRTGFSYDNADAFDGVNQALFEFSAGLKGRGVTEQNSALKSRADGRINYRKFTLSLSRNQGLGYLTDSLSNFAFNIAATGQYSRNGLLSGEECGVGGQQFGRAYDSSEILGDRCLAASMELRFNPTIDLFKYAQFYSFYDGGKTINENPLSTNDPLRKSLSSTGFGLRYGVGNHLTGSIEATKPLTRIVANEGNKKTRLFASINVRF